MSTALKLRDTLNPPSPPLECRPAAILRGHRKGVYHAEFSPDGIVVATASEDGTARLWNVASKTCMAVMEGEVTGWFGDDADDVLCASFSCDGSLLATSTESSKTACLWRVDNATRAGVLEGHKGVVRAISFATDGRRLATASEDMTARVWSVSSLECLAVLEGHTELICSVSFSADATHVVTGSLDKTACIWTGGSRSKVLRGHRSIVNGVSFSPDGCFVATASSDRTTRIWSRISGRCVAVLCAERSHWVRSVVFSADGSYLLTASDDKTARLWSTTTHTCVAVLRGHQRTVRSALFSSEDGSKVVTGSLDETACLWEIPWTKLVENQT